MAVYQITSKTNKNGKTTYTVNKWKSEGYDKKDKTYLIKENMGYSVVSRMVDKGIPTVKLRVSNIYLIATPYQGKKEMIGTIHLDYECKLNPEKYTDQTLEFKTGKKKSDFALAKKYLLNEEGFKEMTWDDLWNYVSKGLPVPSKVETQAV